MEKTNDNKTSSHREPFPPPSFREAISRAEEQVGYRDMLKAAKGVRALMDMQLIHECLAIMAEVYMMSDEREIRISGEWLEVRLVKEMYGAVTYEHLYDVVEAYESLTESVRNKKAYLRAMIYNSVFSLEASTINQINTDPDL